MKVKYYGILVVVLVVSVLSMEVFRYNWWYRKTRISKSTHTVEVSTQSNGVVLALDVEGDVGKRIMEIINNSNYLNPKESIGTAAKVVMIPKSKSKYQISLVGRFGRVSNVLVYDKAIRIDHFTLFGNRSFYYEQEGSEALSEMLKTYCSELANADSNSTN